MKDWSSHALTWTMWKIINVLAHASLDYAASMFAEVYAQLNNLSYTMILPTK